ncbi:MAG: peptidyl-prolyl cis-trans isomerase [Nitrospirota bacterium]|nr:MAG: peptidyl-prolyl cis-trans isomerase [Nitrospirota bacterium]
MPILFKKLLRDPLFHFLAIGGMVFALFSWLGEPESGDSRVIRLTTGEVEAMQKFWGKTHFRLPTDAELEGLIDHRIREEVLSREALAMGMSQGDPLIRRRLAQKMEFLSEGLMDPGEPSEADLRAYAEANPERFQEPAKISFEHIYLNPERRGKNLERDARALLVSMKNSHKSKNVSPAGDPILLNSHFAHITPTSLAGFFGEEFAQAAMELPLGEWQGPVRSGYGLHLVYVQERTEARMPEFKAIRNKVREALMEKRRHDAVNSLYETLREGYHIVVERPMSHDSLRSSQGQ